MSNKALYKSTPVIGAQHKVENHVNQSAKEKRFMAIIVIVAIVLLGLLFFFAW